MCSVLGEVEEMLHFYQTEKKECIFISKLTVEKVYGPFWCYFFSQLG